MIWCAARRAPAMSASPASTLKCASTAGAKSAASLSAPSPSARRVPRGVAPARPRCFCSLARGGGSARMNASYTLCAGEAPPSSPAASRAAIAAGGSAASARQPWITARARCE
eukprot:scaffold14068_cov119-Isochrysis_galbana.AAC.12